MATYDARYKIIVAGDMGIGKTSLMLHFTGEWEQGAGRLVQTFGVEFHVKKVTLANGRVIMLEIWDLGGMENFRSVTRVFFRYGRALIFFDLSNKSSLDSAVNYWMKIATDTCILKDKAPLGLVGTKSDLIKEREVSQERAHIVADELGLRYFEANRSNIELIFMMLVEEIDKLNNI